MKPPNVCCSINTYFHCEACGEKRCKECTDKKDIDKTHPFTDVKGVWLCSKSGRLVGHSFYKTKYKLEGVPLTRETSMILFWGDKDKETGYLSNFYPSPFEADGLKWTTVEHYYQSRKSKDKNEWEKFSKLTTPLKAKRRGRAVKLRGDWEDVKVPFMMKALRYKFKQNPELGKRLVATGNKTLHEDSPFDKEWGFRNGGRDLLGKCLMKIREELRHV